MGHGWTFQFFFFSLDGLDSISYKQQLLLETKIILFGEKKKTIQYKLDHVILTTTCQYTVYIE